jgi:hypothetical protein
MTIFLQKTKRWLLSGLAVAIAMGVLGLAATRMNASADEAAEALPANSDIKDFYVFKSTEDPTRLVLIMTLATDIAPGDTTTFSNKHLYQFNIDTNQDGAEDRVVQALFSGEGLEQQVSFIGPSVPEQIGQEIRQVKSGNISGPVSFAANPIIVSETGVSLRGFAGLRDEPSGHGETKGKNTLTIAIEIPASEVLAENKPTFSAWASVFQKQ